MKASSIRWLVVRPSDGQEQRVYPTNSWRLKWRQQSNERYYRLELDGGLEFGGRTQRDDYALMREIDLPANRYVKRRIRLEVFVDAEWKQIWEGRFTGNHFREVNECSCTVKLTPEIFHAYTCVLDNQDKEINVAALGGRITARAGLFSPFEFLVVRPSSDPPPLISEGWTPFFLNTTDDDIAIYRREYRITACVGGNTYAPPGLGWVLAEDNCSTDGTAKYVRTAPSAAAEIIEAGMCVLDRNGLPVALPPPAGQSYAVTNAPHSAPIIVGPPRVPRTNGPLFQEYVVKYPRTGVTYEWEIVNANSCVSIFSGQGTASVVLRYTSQNGCVQSIVLRVRETNPCGTTPWSASLAVDVVSIWGSLVVMDPSLMSAPSECAIGGSFEVRLPVQLGYAGTAQSNFAQFLQTIWQVTGPATITAQTQTSVTITNTGGTGPIGVSYKFGAGGIGNSTQFSTPITITPSLSPVTDGIVGPTEICAGTGAWFQVQPHAGSFYDWFTSDLGLEISVIGQGSDRVLITATGAYPPGSSVYVREARANSPQWVQVADCFESKPPWFWAIGDVVFEEYEQCRMLSDVMDHAFSSCGEMSSDFMQWFPVNVSTVNYVTGEPNKLMFLLLSNKGDIKYPDASEPARKSITTLKKLLAMLRYLLNVWWYYDSESGRYRLEHLKFFDDAEIIDIEGDLCGTFTYEREQLPRSEKWIAMEAFNSDFVGLPVEYDLEGPAPRTKSPAVGDRSDEYTPGEFSLDLAYIQEASDDEVSRKGFVVLQTTAHDNGSGGYYYDVELEPGLLTGMAMPNGHLSWANLLYNYFRHGRQLANGYMNDRFEEFLGNNRNKIGTTTKKMCPSELLSFNPYKRYRTRFGVGTVQEAIIDLHDEVLTLKTEQQP